MIYCITLMTNGATVRHIK